MSTENKYQFKGTPAPWHVVEYSGFFDIQDQPYYNAKRLTSYDDDVFEGTAVTEKQAIANSTLMAASPELLQACIEAYKIFDYMNIHCLGEKEKVAYENMQAAIHKALNIK